MEKSRYEHCVENHKPLRFGTTGLRDEDSKLTDMQVYLSTKGFLNYLLFNRMVEKGSRVSLAGDFRPSTPRILIAVAAAVIDSGFLVDYCGNIPTPTLAYFGFKNKIPSIMVTASHNPYGQNGVKFMKPGGEVMKEDEKAILDEIAKTREDEYKKTWEESMFDKQGLFKKTEDLNSTQQFLYYYAKNYLKIINKKAEESYIERYKKTFGKILSGIKLVFYEQTSVGRDIIPYVLSELGAEVIKVGRVDETKEFVPVDTEDMKSHILDRMANFAFGNNCQVCISADGDADRPAVLYLKKGEDGRFLYKNGKLDYRFIKGDLLNVLVSLLIKPDFVVVPIHLNHRAGLGVLKKNNIKVKLTKIGEPPVIKAMRDIFNSGNNVKVYGFEANGGGILISDISIPNIGEIDSLAARDTLFPIICVLVLAKIKNLSLEELYKEVFSGENFSHCHSGLVENLPGVAVTLGLERYNPETGRNIVKILKPLNENIYEIDFEEASLGFISEEQNIFDEKVVEHLIRIRNMLHPYIFEIIKKEVKIKKINFLDGVKVYLTNEETIHLRPSGNAAQFRIYIESPDEERAIELVEKAVLGPDGGLVKFINDFLDGKIRI